MKALPAELDSRFVFNTVFFSLLLFIVFSIGWFSLDYLLQLNRWDNTDSSILSWLADGAISRSKETLGTKLRLTLYLICAYYVSSVLTKSLLQTIGGIKAPLKEIALFHFSTIFFASLLVIVSDSPFIDWNPYTERYDQNFAHGLFFLPSIFYVSNAINNRYDLEKGKGYIIMITAFFLTILIAAMLLGIKNIFIEQPTFREFMDSH